MTVTIKDVAARAKVSPKTVSRVMNGEAHVRTAVRDAVRLIVDEMGYRPNAFARSLSSSKSYLISLFLDDPSWSHYAASMQRGALIRCREHSYHMVVEPLDIGAGNWEAQIKASMESLQVDGIILTPPLSDYLPLIRRLEEYGIAYVRISPGAYEARSGSVGIDEQGAAEAMTRHLIELGHRTIGFIGGIPTHAAAAKRLKGFLAAMRGRKLIVRAQNIAVGDFTFRGGFTAALEMLDGSSRPTAIFAANDDMALGVAAAASKLGLSVPGQLSVAGFDDAPTSRSAWPPLTTVRQPIAEMAAVAVDLLIEPAHRTAPDDPRFRRELPFELIIRNSTAPPPRKVKSVE